MDILKKREPHHTEFPNTVRKGYRNGVFDARAGEHGGTGVMVPRAPAMVEDKRGQEAARNSTSPLLPSDDRAAALKAYRRSRGLCFMCGENWGPGHKCASSVQLHVVQEMLDALGFEEPADDVSPVDTPVQSCAISQAAVTGMEVANTFRLVGQI
jgi:hypothetical protein